MDYVVFWVRGVIIKEGKFLDIYDRRMIERGGGIIDEVYIKFLNLILVNCVDLFCCVIVFRGGNT